MRKTTFVALAIVIVSCTSSGKSSEKSVTTPASVAQPARKSTVSIELLYHILKDEGLVKNLRSQVKISPISEHIIDTSAPEVPKNYVAALVETRGVRTTLIVIFDPSKNLSVIAYTEQTFPDLISFYDDVGNEHLSGQGPDLIATPVRLSDSGDVVAVTAKSLKQFVQGSNDDVDVWLYALWKDRVVMLMGYPKNFTHHMTNDAGYARTRTLDTQFIVSTTKTRGLHDVILKSIGDNHKDSSEVEYIFNGIEYIQK